MVRWHKDAFEEVGNHLGCFLHVVEYVHKGMYKRMGRMLVEIDVTKGFVDELTIEWSDLKYHQYLDY